jgi:hypothetical protein
LKKTWRSDNFISSPVRECSGGFTSQRARSTLPISGFA